MKFKVNINNITDFRAGLARIRKDEGLTNVKSSSLHKKVNQAARFMRMRTCHPAGSHPHPASPHPFRWAILFERVRAWRMPRVRASRMRGSHPYTRWAILLPLLILVSLGGYRLYQNTRPVVAAPWSSLHGSYGLRKQLTLVNNAGAGNTLHANSTYKVNIDTKALFNAGSLKSDCADLRVVYQPSDTTATELKRAIAYAQGSTNCSDSSATIVSFPLQADLSNGSNSSYYYLYYNNSSATAYPTADALAAYNVGAKTATFVAPFNGTTTALAAGSGTPTTATGAIRYSGGKSALSFDGINDKITVTQSSSINNITNGSFTGEVWLNLGRTPPSGTIYYELFRKVGASGWALYISSSSGGTNTLSFIQLMTTSNATCDTGNLSMTVGQWHHVAVTFSTSDNKGHIFYDGIEVCTPVAGTGTPSDDSAGNLTIGDASGTNYFPGILDEVRFSNSVRYSAAFTPQTSPFVRDANTKLLLHFDENGGVPGGTPLTYDDSGNNNNGTITGAKYVGGLVGVDGAVIPSPSEGSMASQSYAAHGGVFIEEGTTNKITNPSFENSTAYNTNWSNRWWLNGSIPASSVVAAYKPKGAASLAASYTNLANSGTNDAAPGVAPNFDTATGWSFDGITQYLTTGYQPLPATSALVRYSDLSNLVSDRYVFGSLRSSRRFAIALKQANYMQYHYGADIAQGAGVSPVSGVAGLVGGQGYLNGASDSGLMVQSFADANLFTIGAAEGTGNLNVKIQALSIYNITLSAAQVAIQTNELNETPSLTITQNTTPPYYKFGNSSVKIIATADGDYVTTVNAGNTNTHTLSAYVYDGTTGNVGGTVTNSIATLVFNGLVVVPTYTDMGGGWWRLTYSAAAVSAVKDFGVYVLAGKTIYVDGVQLEALAYATTYADGTMGTGYAWTGTANNSTSTRTVSNVRYSTTSNVNLASGSLSMWWKANDDYPQGTNLGSRTLYPVSFAGAGGVGNLQPFWWTNGTGTWQFVTQYYNGSGNSWTGGYTSALVKDKWYHIVVTWDGTGVQMYVNNNATTKTANTLSMTVTGGTVYLGNYNTAGTDNGVNSDLRLFNAALTSTDVADIYYAGLGSHSEQSYASESYAEAKGQKPVVHWRLDEATGTTAHDSTIYQNNGTITSGTWATPDMCVSSGCVQFNGTSSVVTPTRNITNVQTVSLWVRPTTSTQSILDLDGGSHKLATTNGVLTATGFETVYVNGKVGTAITTNSWNFIEATTATPFNTSSATLGKISSTYFNGFIDDFKLYDATVTADQVKVDYNNDSVGAIHESPVQGGNLSNGLVGYWKMDEASGTLTDSSGNANTGTWYGTGASHYTTGKFGNGGGFNGTDDYVQVATNPSLHPGDIFTLSAWVKRTSTGTSDAIIAAGDTDFHLWFYTDNKLYLSKEGVGNIFTSSQTFTDTTNWHQIVATKNGSSVAVYYDGAILSGTIGNYTINATTQPIYIGGDSHSTNVFSGYIDDARIYNRALSAAEVTQLYQWAPGPVAYWNMDDGSGQSAGDVSGNANTGTLGASSAANTDDPAWTTGKYGKALVFDGSNDYVSVTTTVTGVQTIGFWVKPATTTQSLIDLNGSAYITASAGVISATGFTGSTIYVNGVASSTLTANVWQYVTVTATTSVSASAITIGKANGAYLNGVLDDVRLYSYVRTAEQITQDMQNSGQGYIGGNGQASNGARPSSAVGYWKFDEGQGITANNSGSGGSALNGTLTNMSSPATATSGWTNSGKFNKGLLFDGGNDFVSVTHNTAINVGDTTNSYSVSAWFKTSTDYSTVAYVVAKNDGAGAYPFGLRITSAEKLQFAMWDGTFSPNSISPNTVSDGNWHQALGVRDTVSDKLYLYLDGTLVDSDTDTTTVSMANTDNISIGNGEDSYTRYGFNGSLDEVKIYPFALTPDEVKTDYNQGAALSLGSISTLPVSPSSPSSSASSSYCVPGSAEACTPPVAQWNLDEASGQSAYDTSGNANTGTLGTGATPDTSDPTWINGKTGKGLNFDGANDYLEVTDSASLDVTSNLTLEAWVKTPNVANLKTYSTIIDKSENLYGNKIAYALGMGYRASVLYFDFFVGDGVLNHIDSCNISAAGGTQYNNQWVHLAATRTGSAIKLYINGVDSSNNCTAVRYAPVANAYNLNIGATRTKDANTYFVGTIDFPRIYNYARTPAQIAWDYSKGAPVAYYRFDECTGTAIHSSTSPTLPYDPNLNGTLTGGTPGTCGDGAATAWGQGTTGKYSASLKFDGTNYVTMPTIIKNVGSVSVWVKPTSLTGTNSLISLTSPISLTLVDGVVTAGGWSNTTIYVDGKATTTFPDTNWHLVTVTTTTAFDTTNPITFGLIGASYFTGLLDDVRIYNYPLTSLQVKSLYNENSAVRL